MGGGVIFSRAEMPALAADRDRQADRAEADAATYPAGSTEHRFAVQCAAELRNHAAELRVGINPYEADSGDLWIPQGGAA